MSNDLADQLDMFGFNQTSAFYTSNKTVKMLLNNKFKAQTLYRNSTGIYRCHILASRALTFHVVLANQRAR